MLRSSLRLPSLRSSLRLPSLSSSLRLPSLSSNPRFRVHLAGLLAGLSLTAAAASADAYCLTSACSNDIPGETCTPAAATDCGTPLFWSPACLAVAVQRNASVQVGLDTAESLVSQAFASWETVDCGAGEQPGIRVELYEAVSCDQQEYNQRGGNVNLVVFRDDVWPYVGAGNTLALTTVTYNLDTGEIFDADLEINATANIQLTVSDANVQYDLLSILTHEAGHMLGMAHSKNEEATMKVEYQPGDVELRTLHADDAAGICAAYPPPDIETCDSTPRHGFKDSCGPGPKETEEGCSVGAGSSDHDPSWLALSWLALLAGRSQRRRRTAP